MYKDVFIAFMNLNCVSLTFLPKIFHAFNQMNFLVWQHSCKDFSPLNYTIQQCTIVVSNQPKRFSITCKHVILFLHGAFKVGLKIILNSMKKYQNFMLPNLVLNVWWEQLTSCTMFVVPSSSSNVYETFKWGEYWSVWSSASTRITVWSGFTSSHSRPTLKAVKILSPKNIKIFWFW